MGRGTEYIEKTSELTMNNPDIRPEMQSLLTMYV